MSKPAETIFDEVGRPDVEHAREEARQSIALWLVGLLCAIVVLAFVALFVRGAASEFTSTQFFLDLKQVLDVVVGPVITLVASAVGFYFGNKQAVAASRAGRE